MIQSADCIETILFSSKLSSLRIKSDFVHESIDPSSLNILKENGAFSKDITRSRGTFLKVFIARSLKYITSPLIVTFLIERELSFEFQS